MISLDCKINQNQITHQWTVGDLVLLNCSGSQEKLVGDIEFVLPKSEDKYKLQLLKLKKISDFESELTLTSYKAGDHKLEGIKLKASGEEFVLSPLELKVNSVLDPKDQQPKPFESLGPLPLEFPWLYLMIALGAILFVLGSLALKIFHIWQRQKWVKKINELMTRQNPLAEFSTQVRKLKKQLESVPFEESLNELEKQFLLFLTREFVMPAHVYSHKMILKDLKKYHPEIYVKSGENIKMGLKELAHLKKSSKLTEKDLVQIIDILMKVSEEI